MKIDLETLGINKEELKEKVIERAVENLFFENGEVDGFYKETTFADEVDKKIQKAIEEKVNDIAKKHVVPSVKEKIDNFVLQKTNEWGQAKSDPMSFQDYMISRAEHYIKEPVNRQGKTKEQDSFGWLPSGTRIEYLIDKHLQYNISNAIDIMLKDINSNISEGLTNAVRMKIAELQKSISIAVKTK